MRASQFLLATAKQTPADAEVVSHQLMLRAGMIRPVASGMYSWLPLGTRVLRKVESIVREEMDRAGAQEVLMPAVQPSELWKESGRWNEFGPELLRFKDRHLRDFCLGPTHEEVITDIARREIKSYKQLPINFYQVQTKFRDEVRPRFGVMRSREFIMKDAYSFGLNESELQQAYDQMEAAYRKIFTRTGLDFRMVEADSGSIGGAVSNEFHVLAESGEDAIAFSDTSSYAANVELVPCLDLSHDPAPPTRLLGTVDTPNVDSMDSLSQYLGLPKQQCVKTLIVRGEDDPLVALLIRGDHQLNLLKAGDLPNVAKPVTFATPEEASQAGLPTGSIGPVDLTIPISADLAVTAMSDFVCGANRPGQHHTGVNWERDLPTPPSFDIRNAVAGDPSPDGKGKLNVARGIEVGHIFQLGTKYSEALQAVCLDEEGKSHPLAMGCYGIGVTRVVAAAIEQNHDDHGIVWPTAISPFHVVLLPINMHKSIRLKTTVNELYNALTKHNVEVLFDDRQIRPGVMYADADLIGIPHRIVIGDRSLDKGVAEYKNRRGSEDQEIPLADVVEFLITKLQGEEIMHQQS